MKISALIIAAVSAQKNKPLTQQIAEEDRQRVDVRFRKVVDLISGWIDTEAAGWKKQFKLKQRLTWIEGRMEDYLNDGCYEKAPDEAELAAIAEELDDDSVEKGLAGIDQTTPYNKVFRLNKSAKRITRLFLSNCNKYDRLNGQWDRLKNGMAKAYRRIHRLGGDYESVIGDY